MEKYKIVDAVIGNNFILLIHNKQQTTINNVLAYKHIVQTNPHE